MTTATLTFSDFFASYSMEFGGNEFALKLTRVSEEMFRITPTAGLRYFNLNRPTPNIPISKSNVYAQNEANIISPHQTLIIANEANDMVILKIVTVSEGIHPAQCRATIEFAGVGRDQPDVIPF